ncbi:MAG TPA: glycerol-3-phosphate dehydrogenase/oxidase [Gemmatimonadaceae bacterium]|jgi:glycerol-3-phosphate dehydrogenase|nr:glycerol-3-phosphate dehydrogenase/oxidase [Gemmatimonadaceae bacterium]
MGNPSAIPAKKLSWREDTRARLARDRFDVLVIGGGINGAGIARDAALRGLSVALIERGDFASGTSSRSSRLVHGGVRYLEHGFFHLVFESSRERRILLEIAPHLVKPLRFTWPVYEGARIPKWKLNAGLWLYDLLAAFRNVARHHSLNAAQVLATEPKLKRDGLRGGAIYYDASTNDARLTIANVVDAVSAGAAALNYAEAISLSFDGARASGASVRDQFTQQIFEVRAKCVVNATGPWTDAISRIENPSSPAAVLGTKGVHIAVPADRVGNRAAVTMLAHADQRVMFVLPGATHTIIGTTDTETNERPDQVRATRGDVNYLLDAANSYFPDAKLTTDDVVCAWAGIRPLIASGNAGDPAGASREQAITVGLRGVIAVTGGKLTTYRSMSEEVVDRVESCLGKPRTKSDTATRPLPGSAIRPADVDWRSAVLVAGLPYTTADVSDAAGHEFACTVADVLVRRTHLAFETRDHGVSVAPRVAEILASRLGWSAAGIARELANYRAEVARLFTIDDAE